MFARTSTTISKQTMRQVGTLQSMHSSAIHSTKRSDDGDDNTHSRKVNDLITGILDGKRASLSKAITLVESTNRTHQRQSSQMMNALLLHRKDNPEKYANSFRVGISGTPGVGKSTFINRFGEFLTREQNCKVGVMAVDPSSSITGGSIMGDKTRMMELSVNPNAYIRPSKSGGTLGGVGRNTNETILLFEAGGFDTIIVETVGVGQSEIAVSKMTDAFLLLMAPAAGDELQGIKRGIMELADVIVVNKADGDLEATARITASEYMRAINFMRPRTKVWKTQVLRVSSLNQGTEKAVNSMDPVWATLQDFRTATSESGFLQHNRAEQRLHWMYTFLEEQFMHNLMDAKRKPIIQNVEKELRSGLISPRFAAEKVWKLVHDDGEAIDFN